MTAGRGRSGKTIAIVVTIAVLVVAGGVVLARQVFGCTPPRDQARVIAAFQADPLFATAPADGHLVRGYAHTYACDNGHGNSPTSPGFAEVMRLYRTPTVYDAEELHQRFDPPAFAAGWHTLPGDVTRTSDKAGDIKYCKEVDGRASIAYLNSSSGADNGSGPTRPGIQVMLSAFPERGSTCDSFT